MKALRFAGPFGFLLSIPALYALSPAAPLLTPLAILLTLLVMEQLRPVLEAHHRPSPTFRLLAILYIPSQLAMTLWAALVAAWLQTSFVAFVSLGVSAGACAGVFGMLAAHEMVHSRSHWERRLGLLMLFGMSYPHFRLAHVYGHHRYAATRRDASTAHYGESFYRFLIRTIPAQIAVGWNFERRRTQIKSVAILHNRIIQGALLLALLYVALLVARPSAAGFLAAESAVAIVVLELFNYVAHYGLVRKARNTRLEPLGDHHSWNSPGLGNFLIFNMGQHSDHHRNPAISYEGLRSAPRAPDLPFGYAAAILMALAPPLWRAAMDHRIEPHAAKSAESGYSGESPAAAMP
jgi:alkane 1-monooxygenase